MIIQTAPPGQPRLAIMMYEHTALSHQFARVFGNDRFQAPEPNDLMFHVVCTMTLAGPSSTAIR